ncbi:hypothetical protein Ddye_028992 [Dipteronia dyeriana]|uniref:non-specific serine/threonine protein kinase n=1 Tax=Dipteronia dyeriana TaxID=168575 RepID=A0AAD9WL86_9ROSI|nr:hypothetical protein Ddye_028992 [Dipteronia dyeriana]
MDIKALSGNETDQLALLEIKAKIIRDPFQAMSSWNNSVNLCQWRGISCSNWHQRVTRLDLHSQLGGSISPHIGNLSFLREVRLQNNQFSHRIPGEIGKLFRLQSLRLENNSLGGDIPENISNRVKLVHLALDGEIPSSLGNISSLKRVDLVLNSFQGSIPEILGQLKSLLELQVSTNNLSGAISSSIYNLSSLTAFIVAENQLRGSLPPYLGLTLPNLEYFYFHTNQFTSTISNASNLMGFTISKNQFTGKVPSFTMHASLWDLEIDDNNLGNEGKDDLNFLSSLVNCTELEGLPTEVGNLVNLGYLDVSENNFSGEISASLSSCTSLEISYMQGNRFEGSIPQSLSSLRGNDFKALIYEYMVNGSLEEWLHPTASSLEGQGNLSILQSLNIATEVAHALDYLYHGCQTPIIHCDLKPSNVLIDSDMTAHVGDFGLVRVLLGTNHLHSSNETSSLAIKGLIGYGAPDSPGERMDIRDVVAELPHIKNMLHGTRMHLPMNLKKQHLSLCKIGT